MTKFSEILQRSFLCELADSNSGQSEQTHAIGGMAADVFELKQTCIQPR